MEEENRFLATRWTVGLFGSLVFGFLIAAGRIKIQGYDRRKLDPGDNGLILISNHPSFWETALLPFLFFPWYLFSLRFVPFSVVDKVNYYLKRWFRWFRAVCLPIERGNPREEIKTMDRMKGMGRQGKSLILYPESTRTFRRVGEDPWKVKFSSSGRVIREFPQGIRRLFLDTQFTILPVWTEGGEEVIPNISDKGSFPPPWKWRPWKRTIIKIGEPFRLEGIPKREILATLENIMLELGDT